MNEPLRLEYTCTPAEQDEAEHLVLADQLGVSKSPKWITNIVMILFLLVLLVGLYFKICQDWPNHPIECGVGEIVALAVAYAFVIRKKHQSKSVSSVVVELSMSALKIIEATGQVSVSWNAFDKRWESEKLFVLRHKSGLAYIFPKRIFPNEASRDWFREVGIGEFSHPNVDGLFDAALPNAPAHSTKPDEILIHFKLGYFNYIDRSLASWQVRGMMCFFLVLFLTAFIMAALKPAPRAVYSHSQLFCFFVVPFLVIIELFLFFFITTYTWLMHRQAISTMSNQSVTIADIGFMCESSLGQTAYSWERPTSFKETRRSFFIWQPGTRFWLLLPKSAFPSAASIDACRTILCAHAKPSTWFF